MYILNEEWRDVSGFEGFYQVSSFGRVRSLSRTIDVLRDGKVFQYPVKGRIMKPSIDSYGYLKTTFYKGDIKLNVMVHQLVIKAFVGDRPEGFQVNHKNGNKLDNFVSNLEFCTPQQNTVHAHGMGLCSDRKGENSAQAKLSEADVRQIRARVVSGERQRVIAKYYGVSERTITDIKQRRTWSHLL